MGSGSFQDLGITIIEDMIKRPIQVFSKTHDKGVDGIFDGTIDDKDAKVRSIIQCKHTSKPSENLKYSSIKNELPKVKKLIENHSIGDYFLVINKNVSVDTNLKIENEFNQIGIQKCKILGNESLNRHIQESPRLRMMVPRLYGLGDLSNILDERAYKQTKLILESESEDLDKFVPTEAYRKSLKAISENKFVLILGEPMSGKSTIKTCLAISAADNWECVPIVANKPSEIKTHLNPDEKQIFLVDDAWGIVQYRDDFAEEWNQILQLMNSAIKKNTRFLLTSRDYIWNSAKSDLKKGKFPLFNESKVIIEVQNLTEYERAQMVYYHLKHGDQPKSFKTDIKEQLPAIVKNRVFFPESARRLGNKFFTKNLNPNGVELLDFFDKPKKFMFDIIEDLPAEYKAAVALIYINNGKLSSPIENSNELNLISNKFCKNQTRISNALEELDGSLLYCESSDSGKFWKFKHPTIGEAFAESVSKKHELIEIYLRGAKPETILNNVVCTGINLEGAKVEVPPKLYKVLVNRIKDADVKEIQIIRFICNRADKSCTKLLMKSQPRFLNKVTFNQLPIFAAPGTKLVLRLSKFGLLPTELRSEFVNALDTVVTGFADTSYISDKDIHGLLTVNEIEKLNDTFEREIIENLMERVEEYTAEFNPKYNSWDELTDLKFSVETYIDQKGKNEHYESILEQLDVDVRDAISYLERKFPGADEYYGEEDWTPEETEENSGALEEFFQDVDE